jgi:outer membrane protein assembly factor BamD (BamD/ComL family)
MTSIILIVISLSISTPDKLGSVNFQFEKASDSLLNKRDGEALTRFLLIAGTYAKYPHGKWGLYFAASLYEKKGDFKAARVKYQQLIKEYPSHPLIKRVKNRESWLNWGLKTSKPTILRDWNTIYHEKKRDSKWALKCEDFLKKRTSLYWNSILRLRLAGWYLLYQKVDDAIRHLELVCTSSDSKATYISLKILAPIYFNMGKNQEINKIIKKIDKSTPQLLNLVENLSRKSSKMEKLKSYTKFVTIFMVLVLLALIFPFKQKRSFLPLMGIPLGLLFWFFPQTGPTLFFITVNVALFLFLMGKGRPKYLWITGMIYITLIPIHSLILTDNFPWNIFLV